jgi:glyoxylase-like metal-dependent hydrolase (beta-lactamase superfamily II)
VAKVEDGERSEDRVIGRVTVLGGVRGGKYPHGNSLLIEGSEESLIIDPSLSLIGRPPLVPSPDRVINSHCHEDHIAGNHLFPDAVWQLHELDAVGLRSLDDMMAIYGYAPDTAAEFSKYVVEEYHYTPRPDAQTFVDGDVFDLGGVSVRVIHTPGHTRGHSCFFVEPESVLYLGDIDLSSFGPYYGDAWSSLRDFEKSLDLVRGIEAEHYATFHHIGVLDGREAFLARLDRFAAVIADRERRLLEYLAEPRTIDDIVAHRFVYRPGDPVQWADSAERGSMSQHIARLAEAGRVVEVEPGRYRVN